MNSPLQQCEPCCVLHFRINWGSELKYRKHQYGHPLATLSELYELTKVLWEYKVKLFTGINLRKDRNENGPLLKPNIRDLEQRWQSRNYFKGKHRCALRLFLWQPMCLEGETLTHAQDHYSRALLTPGAATEHPLGQVTCPRAAPDSVGRGWTWGPPVFF